MEEEYRSTTVYLFMYDLSEGKAKNILSKFVGFQLDAIWHTAIVVYGKEYYFGSKGINSGEPGNTGFGEPQDVKRLGETYLPYSVFLRFINGLSNSRFAQGTYNFLKHNCNCFTEIVSNFLVGTSIPKPIIDLPKKILQTSNGQFFGALVEKLTTLVRPDILKSILGLLQKISKTHIGQIFGAIIETVINILRGIFLPIST